jgi:hypothetical protein
MLRFLGAIFSEAMRSHGNNFLIQMWTSTGNKEEAVENNDLILFAESY